MTKQELEQLKSLKQEVKQLQNELRHMPLTTDSVKGSMDEFPYIEQTFKIVGVDMDKAKRLRKKLGRKLDELQDMIEVMEDWLETVPDSEIRTILRLKYRNGMNWARIGEELGYDRTTVSKKHSAFIKSNFPTNPTLTDVK